MDLSFVSVEIEDSGSGISAENEDRIFEPYFSTKNKDEGTGLGLNITKRIVEEQGGSISFVSIPGQTIFKVVLPITREQGKGGI